MQLTDLPQAKAWVAEVGTFDLRTFTLSNVSIAEACAVATLMSPEFIEYRGCILLRFVFDALDASGVDTWIDHFRGDVQAVETMVNHIHLWEFFKSQSEDEDEALVDLARRMATSWKCSARSQFPERVFAVEFDDGTNDYGPTLAIHTV
ncbi:hypothetical protein I6A84_04380 [Frankia sp. CNm7]|uniref:Uncharacterized protein n=1 Tax=Frankia nepalensis TaxID=1836974 RepID=A0A937R5P0_9ACTN|nr:hypothetical protein [Frankia nepalensis]MBL7498757.1 hypothetical protein [Frankia nepalensis]MBL7508379.1 hypothetical protein [Frankia nepalensis]MBL7517379.1 hypothetical protein [Frankia nepalensis]MBL7626208.1 hypothetical protein [Frankia nepalensis]